MKNDIIRKLTSLTLMSIMVAGGLTFAIPSALPQAVAESATSGTLTVSTTEFGGQQILEITVNDPDFRAIDTTHVQPQVTIAGNNVQMIQVSNGIWYAYVADDTAVSNPRIDNNSVSGVTPSIAIDSDDALHQLTLLTEQIPAGQSNTGTSATNWPYALLHDFTSGDTFDVTYRSEAIAVTYDDDLTGSASIAVDRTDVPAGAIVHIDVSDTRLNLDPTGKDSWTFTVNATEDGVPTTMYMAVPPATTPTEVALGDAGHGYLEIPPQLTIATSEDDATTVDTITLTETDSNSGVFASSIHDNDNVSLINLVAGALENSRVTVSYAGNDATFTVRDESVDISITSDDFWNSGEPATVTVDAPDLNYNTKDSDDIKMESDEIPTIEINSPVTIVDFTPALDQETNFIVHNDNDATHVFVDDNLNNNENASRTSMKGFYTTTVVAKNNTDTTSLLEGATTVTTLNIDETEDASKLYTFNSDVATGSALTFTMEVDISAPFYLLKSYSSNDATFTLVDVDGTTISDDGTQEGPLSANLTLTVTLETRTMRRATYSSSTSSPLGR